MRVVLFDIDGTILWTDGAGPRAVQRALEDVFGAPVPQGHEFDGKTDPQIVRELMQLAGVAHGDVDSRLGHALDRYVELLHTELGALESHDHVLPGVRELLDALEQRDDVLLGLLTGNVLPGAVAKLTAVGIDATRFRVGAFGSDNAHRPELPAIALERAEALLGRHISGSDVVVIGDTPADMGCGRGIGARAVGVATGRYSTDDLRACGVAEVFVNLSDTEAVVRAIMGA